MTRGPLEAEFRLRRGTFTLEVALRAAPGETVALVGPNGSGKTSTLLALAGLAPIDSGHIALGDAVFDDPAAGRFTPAHRRGIGIVFQDYVLFPHMTVVENVAYGVRAGGTDRRRALTRAAEWLTRVGMADAADRRGSALSGGEAQRVALARVLATHPKLLLLDEPLAALDVSTRAAVRRSLRDHLGTFAGPRIVVTHDPAEAFALADRVVVLESGRVAQSGTPDELRRAPVVPYVADLVGVNLVRGVAAAGRVTTETGAVVVAADQLTGEVLAVVHPRAIALFPKRPDGSPRNTWRTVVEGIEPTLDRLRVQLGGPLPVVAEITGAAATALGLTVGTEVWVAIKASEVTLLPA